MFYQVAGTRNGSLELLVALPPSRRTQAAARAGGKRPVNHPATCRSTVWRHADRAHHEARAGDRRLALRQMPRNGPETMAKPFSALQEKVPTPTPGINGPVEQGDRAMHEQHQPDHDDFDFTEIWRSAQYRRTDEMRAWLSRLFARWPRTKSADLVEPQYHQGKIAA
jgi:hypothetical protein